MLLLRVVLCFHLFQVDFVKECGDDNQCFSNLQFEVSLDARKEDNLYILLEGEFSEVQLTFIITNLGEAAYLAQVFVQKPINLDYQSVNGNGQVSNYTVCDFIRICLNLEVW